MRMFKTIEAKASKEQAKKQKMSKWFSMPSLDEPWNRNSYKGKRCGFFFCGALFLLVLIW